MSKILISIASILGIADIFMGLFILYHIIRCVFKPILFKGKLCSFIFAIILLSLLFSEIENLITGIENKPFLFFMTCLSIFIPLIIIGFRIIKRRQYSIKQLDIMDGHRFEYACADILKSNGFKNVKVTKGSGDFGVDILAKKNGIRYAVQCKRYSKKLDNTSIQEVIGGLAYYQCQKGIVMTNNYFTEPAKTLAKVNNVELWDRDKLVKLAFNADLKNKRKSAPNLNRDKDPIILRSNYEKNTQNVKSSVQKDIKNSISENIVTKTEQQYTYDSQKESLIKSKYKDIEELLRFAKNTSQIANLQSLKELTEKHCKEQSEYILYFYNEIKDFDIIIIQTILSFQSNKVKYTAELFGNTTISKIRRSKGELIDYLNVIDVKFELNTHSERTINIIVPLPVYIYNLYLNTDIYIEDCYLD